MFSVGAAFPSNPSAAVQQVIVRRCGVQLAGQCRAVVRVRAPAWVRSLARAAQGRQSGTVLLARARLYRATRCGPVLCSGWDTHVTVVASHVDVLRYPSHTARMAEPNLSFKTDPQHSRFAPMLR